MSPIATKPLLRYLRIGWTGFFGVLCLLLIGLWVRSYWYQDLIFVKLSQSLATGCISFEGVIVCGIDAPPGLGEVFWQSENLKTVNPVVLGSWRSHKPKSGFRIGFPRPNSFFVSIPHYFAVLLFAAAAILPNYWRGIMGMRLIPRRFSLRSLLIFTTLVAVVLGVIVWVVSNKW
jgi:hypothetical protein